MSSRAIGRAFQDAEEKPGSAPVAMISEGLWKRRFGGEASLVGRNLTLNGIDAMKETDRTKELTITSEAGDGELVVSVSDTGTGISPAHADRIFDAFYTTKSHGLGMGLAISRSIVESHGGRLWVTSNPGPGANFHLTLPIQPRTAHGVA